MWGLESKISTQAPCILSQDVYLCALLLLGSPRKHGRWIQELYSRKSLTQGSNYQTLFFLFLVLPSSWNFIGEGRGGEGAHWQVSINQLKSPYSLKLSNLVHPNLLQSTVWQLIFKTLPWGRQLSLHVSVSLLAFLFFSTVFVVRQQTQLWLKTDNKKDMNLSVSIRML